MKQERAIQAMQVFFDMMCFTIAAVDIRTNNNRSKEETGLLAKTQLSEIEKEVKQNKTAGTAEDLLQIQMKVCDWCKSFEELNRPEPGGEIGRRVS